MSLPVKPQTVLVTGAFGNVGRAVLRALLSRGHRVRTFDLPTPAARRDASKFAGLEMTWGDVRDRDALSCAAQGVDAAIHLAFLLPPTSELDPERAQAINVQGSCNLVLALEERSPAARLLCASSYAIHGDTRKLEGLLTPDSPVQPISEYNRHKIAVEALVRASRLTWCILRLGVVMSAEAMRRTRADPRLIFDLPYDCRHEFVHGEDVATAFARCLEVDEAWGKVLLIGAGKSGQVLYLDLINRTLNALGLGSLPKEAFSTEARQGGGWMDTAESQRLLGYQHWTLEAHLKDVAQKAGIKRHLARVFSPLVRWYLVRASPYTNR